MALKQREAAIMNKNNETPLQTDRLKQVLRIAEIKATDKEDMENCVNDMQRSASLDESEARIVAKAVRAKHLPNILREAGAEEMIKEDLLTPVGVASETADFAKDKNDDDHDEDNSEFVENEDFDLLNSEEDLNDDMGEANDETNIATFEIDVPADKVEEAQKAVQEALDKIFSGDASDDELDEEDHDTALEGLADEDVEEVDDLEGDMDIDMSTDVEEADDAPLQHTASTVNKIMTPEERTKRQAEREAILQRVVVAEEASKPKDRGLGKDTTEGTYGGQKAKPFQHNDAAQYHGEEAFPTMSLKGGEGNSQRGDNPNYADQPIPTMNPENLQLKGAVDAVKLDGQPDGTIEYVIDFNHLDDVPSAEPERGTAFEIPTQMENLPRKTTVASQNDTEERLAEVEDVVYNYLVEAGVDGEEVGKMTVAEGVNLLMKIASEKSKDTEANDLNVEINAEDAKDERKAAIQESRIKTAYSCAFKLALNNVLAQNEVDGYAETMLNDRLPVDSMIRQTTLLMRSANSSAQRVAQAAAENFGTARSASSQAVSSSPALSGDFNTNSASTDIQEALRGVFTMPREN